MAEFKEQTLRRYQKAVDRKKVEDLKKNYIFVCPRRYPGGGETKVADEVFDSTGIDATSTKVGKQHNQIFPPFHEWVDPVPTIRIPEEEEHRWEKYKKQLKELLHKALEISNFHEVIEDVLTDNLIAEGALALYVGEPECPFVFEAIDWDMFFTEEDYEGRPQTVFVRDNMTLDNIRYKWRKAEIPKELEDLQKNSDREFEVVACYLYDIWHDNYTYQVWLTDGERLLWEKKSVPTSPLIVFRINKRMRRTVGYGPVQDVLPNIQTSNYVQKLILQNAAFAVSGLWQTEDNGVINAANTVLRPGAIIPKEVGSKGLEPLEVNRNFDVSQFILTDQQNKIREQIMGNTLPQIKDGVRSASEYAYRQQEKNDREIPAALKVSYSQNALLKRMYAILTSPQMKASPYFIEPFSYTVEGRVTPVKVKIKAANPLIRMQLEADADNSLNTYANARQLFGNVTECMVKHVDYCHRFLLDKGFDPEFLEDIDDAKKNYGTMQQQQNELVAAEIAEQKAKDNGS